MARLWTSLTLLLTLGCQEKIEDRFLKCHDLLADSEQLEESLKCFTAASRPMIRSLIQQRKETGSTLEYLGNYHKMLDYDDIVGAPDVQGNIALLVVKKKKEQTTLTLVLEDDEWRIDPTDLPAFWRPLDEAAVAR